MVSGPSSKTAAETPKLSEHFRRTDPRYDRRLEVEILVGSTRLTAVSRNVSLGGMFVETQEPLSVFAPLVVKFRVPTQPELIEVSGEVRWIEPGDGICGMGIRWDGLRAREVWALNRYFQS